MDNLDATERYRMCDDLIAALGLPEASGRITIEGTDPVIASPHRLGLATATALAAQGHAAAEFRHSRGGDRQNVSIRLPDAVAALDTNLFMRLNDHSVKRSDVLTREPLNGAYETADGRHLVFQATYPHHRNGLLNLLDSANTRPALEKAVSHWRAEDLEEACAARNLPGVIAREPAEWRTHPQGRLLAQEPVIRIDKIANGDPVDLPPGARPGSGIRVIDATHVIAGPGLSRTLAEHGADVLNILAPRMMDPWSISMDTGIGKRSAFIDLDLPEDVATLRRLTAGADVFVQSYAPGSFDRRDLSAEKLAQAHPGIIYVSISCYGDNGGPWSLRRGFDPQAQATTGIMATEGGDGAPRPVPTLLLNDYLTAYLGAAGVFAALRRRSVEGGSYHVRLTLARTAMWVQDFGRLAQDRVAASPAALRPEDFDTAEMDTPFGRLQYLPPVTRLSRTPAYWNKPPCPPGSHRPDWADEPASIEQTG